MTFSRRWRRVAIAALLAVTALPLSCGREKRPAVPPPPPSPAPFTREELAGSEELRRLLIDLAPTVGPLGPESFLFDGEYPFVSGLFAFESWLAMMHVEWARIPDFCPVSPDGAFAFNFFPIFGGGEGLHVERGPDSEVAVIDLATRQAVRAIQVGTPAEFLWGTWVAPRAFLVGGVRESTDGREWHLALWRVGIEGAAVAWFDGPKIPSARREEVDAVFARWRASRFPAIAAKE